MRYQRESRTLLGVLALTGLLCGCSGGASPVAVPNVPVAGSGVNAPSAADATQRAVASANHHHGGRDVTVSPKHLEFNGVSSTQTFVASEDDDAKIDEDWQAGAASSDPSVCSVTPDTGHAEDPHNSGRESITFTVTPVAGGKCTVTVTDLSGTAHHTAKVSVEVDGARPSPTPSPSPSSAPSSSPTPMPTASATPTPKPTPTVKPPPTPTPTPVTSGCPNPVTTAPPHVSPPFTTFGVGMGPGGTTGQFFVETRWSLNTFGAKLLESNTGTPGSFSDVSSGASFFRFFPGGEGLAPCVNGATLSSDPLNHHSWRQGETVYLEVETVNNTALTGPPSNVVSITIPVSNGDSGLIGVASPGQLQPKFTWANPLQGYRDFFSQSPNGPFVQNRDTGFLIDQEYVGDYPPLGYPGTQVCVEIQGYDQNGKLGRVSSPACGSNP